MTKACPACGEVKPLEEFTKDRTRSNGRGPYCKPCKRHKNRERERSARGRALAIKRGRRYRERHPEKERARCRRYHSENPDVRNEYRAHPERRKKERVRWATRNAVAQGAIEKPEACSECGSNENIQAHHEDYSKPLDVVWLCSICHGRRHRKELPDAI